MLYVYMIESITAYMLQEFGVSRSTVREALHELATNGF